MATAIQKITLSASRDIPFNKLMLSQSNVRRVKAGISIEELAEDIARRTLLQGLSVRPVVDADGNETGMFEVPAGGRRFRALELLVKQKRLAKTAPVPCIVRDGGIAEEDSLAENVQRVALHPLDQFRAFQALREKGLGDEAIAARFFVAPTVVKQRLRLAAVSPRLLDIYAEDGMTLDHLMAFTVTADHARQEQVWDALSRSYGKEPYQIRRQLTEGAVRASDRRALFIGVDVYETAGGVVMRDLFNHDDGGWLQDPALLDRLVAEKLHLEAERLHAEGWKWLAVATDFLYGHTAGLRRLVGEPAGQTEGETSSFEALTAEYDRLEEEHAGTDDLPEAVAERLGEIEAAMAAFENRPLCYDPAEIARAGTFISIDGDGELRIERGFVRPEDEALVEPVPIEADDGQEPVGTDIPAQRPVITIGNAHTAPEPQTPEEDNTIRPLSDRLMTELTAHRTLALRNALGEQPEVAFLAALHALCLQLFYNDGLNSCLDLDVKSATFNIQAPGLNDTAAARTLTDRHQLWLASMPKHPEDLWAMLSRQDETSSRALFGHCIGLSINALHEAHNRRPQTMAHADVLAEAVNLDMATAGWKPTVDTYLGRVPKARILEAVRQAKGEKFAGLIDHLKKPDMAQEAERLLDGTGWLPEPLRPTGSRTKADEPVKDLEALPDFLAGEEDEAADREDPQQYAAAAE